MHIPARKTGTPPTRSAWSPDRSTSGPAQSHDQPAPAPEPQPPLRPDDPAPPPVRRHQPCSPQPQDRQQPHPPTPPQRPWTTPMWTCHTAQTTKLLLRTDLDNRCPTRGFVAFGAYTNPQTSNVI